MATLADESGRPVDELGEQPAPSVPSTPDDVQPPSTPSGSDSEVLAKLEAMQVQIDGIEAGIPEQTERAAHSVKDRRFRVLEGIDPDLFIQFKSYLDRFGGDEGLAIREMQVDAMLERGSVNDSTGGSRSGPAPTTREDLAGISEEILADAEIGFQDPGYLGFVQQNQGKVFTKKEWRSALRGYVFQRLRTGEPGPGPIITEGGETPPPPNLQREYDAEIAALRGSRDYAGLVLVKTKYRKLGLDV